MKFHRDSGGAHSPGSGAQGIRVAGGAGTRAKPFTLREFHALTFGLLLGLALVKFGNPVVLESKIARPQSLSDFWTYAWPPQWSVLLLVPLALAGGVLVFFHKPCWPGTRWLWVLPTLWFGWQLVSATHTVDGELTRTTLRHFGGCLACYLLGGLLLGEERCLRLMLVGLLAGFTFCLVRAVNQRLFEFPAERRFLIESDQAGWTNVAPDVLLEMQRDGIVISTNGVIAANPVMVAKYSNARVFGTLVYPNALAGAVLLLLPVSIVLAFHGTRQLRQLTRILVIALTLFLGMAGLFWTGSKSGWLIAMALGGIGLFRLNWSSRVKQAVLTLLVVGGLVAFGARFHRYFAGGAASVGARFDYWRAAAQIALSEPAFGTGPGTFQRPYARIKTPEAEMARLTHNDYLQQFCDSGFVGGISYVTWIVLMVLALGKSVWRSANPLDFGIFIGLLGWLVQGLSEFSLYVPALAWTAFTLGGLLLKRTGNQIDNAGIRR